MGAFDCLDLTRRFEGGEDTNDPREVRFLLSGPRVSGLVSWTCGYSFDGRNKVEVFGGGRVATAGGMQFSMFMRPHFLHDDVSGRPDTRGSHQICFSTLPSRVVRVLDGRGGLERATRLRASRFGEASSPSAER